MPQPPSNDPDFSPPPSLHPSHPLFDSENPSPSQSPLPPGPTKKKHVCQTCQRAFTTSGHLARHTRIHTGERNHKCPFPGCETRCSRQDNLQQHYRIHLSPGSRRNSGSATRAAMNRASASDRSRSARRRSKNPSDSPPSASPPTAYPSPPDEPPPLAQAYPTMPPGVPEPPNTPPPLAQAYPTLPPPTAPAYHQQSFPARPSSRSSRSTPDAAYHSPNSYAQPSLASSAQYATYRPEEVTYPPSSQGSRSSSYGRPADDSRWGYHTHPEQSYPASESDRFSPVSPATNANGHYTEPVSPVDSINGHHRGHPQAHTHMPQETVSYFNSYHQPAARHTQPNPAVATSASPVSLQESHQVPSSHRHSIAHISNPMRQHSPASTNSASPVVSTPPTPGYPYVPHSMGGYSASPSGSISPVAPAPAQQQQHAPPVVPVYNSYESSSLASAGYSHPPPAQAQMQQQQQHHHHQEQQQQMYDRTLPALTATHAREPQSQSTLHTHFNYPSSSAFHHVPVNGSDRYGSPRPVLAPIQDSRVLRGDTGSSMSASMRYAGSPQPQSQHHQTQSQSQTQPQSNPHPQHQSAAMQSLASVSRNAGNTATAHHAFAYPSHSHPHPHSQLQQQQQAQPAHPHSVPEPASYAHTQVYAAHTSAGSAHAHGHGNGAASSPTASSYYYQTQAVASHGVGGGGAHVHAHTSTHAPREPSPEGADVDQAAEQYHLELHQPQPQRASLASGNPHVNHQYMQAGAVLTTSQHHAVAHPVWRAGDFRERLVP